MIQPIQVIPESEKDYAWNKANIDYFIEMCWGNSTDNYELDLLERAVQGILDMDDYSYVLNPYNTENKKFSRRPAKLRNLNIILPIITLYLGERNRKNNNVQVIVTNPDSENRKKEEITKAMQALLAQDFVNKLNEAGIQTGVDSKEIPSYEEKKEEIEDNYNDTRAEFGQEALDYLIQNLKIDDKMQEAFYQFLVFGKVFSYKGVLKDDVDYDILDVRNVRWLGKPSSGLIEDCEAVVVNKRLTLSEIVSKYGIYLTEESIKLIETRVKTATTELNVRTVGSVVDENWQSTLLNSNDSGNEIDFFHCAWKTTKKIQYLTYLDEMGQVKEMEVDENYKLDKKHGDISLVEDWITEWREGFRIDKDIYFEKLEFEETPCRVGLVQRDELNNNASCKLPFNGSIYTFPSIAKQGLPYQALYNIFNFRFELTMARNKDKIMMMPIGLIPSKEGWDEDKWIYMAENSQFGFYDETAENAAVAIQGMKVMDMSLAAYAASMKDVLRMIKEEWWDSIGMNRQRYGDNAASDGKSVNEQAIFRSTIITDELYRQFRKFYEADMNGILDTSKVAWVNGKKGTYLNSDKKVAFLNVEPVEHMEANYGVFCVVDEKEEQKLREYQNLAQPFAQNSVAPHIVAEMIGANNSSKARQLLKKGWAIQKAFEKQQQEAQQASNERIAQNALEAEKIKDERERYKIDEENKTDVKVAYINAMGRAASGFQSEEVDVNDFLDKIDADVKELSSVAAEKRKQAEDSKKSQFEQANKSRAMSEKAREKEIDLKIAKTNKN